MLDRAEGGHLDLSDFVHDRRHHPDPMPLIGLAWALLQAEAVPPGLVLPSDLAARRALARSGLLFVAERRDVELVVDDAALPLASALRQSGPSDPPVLPGFDWKRYDELLTTEDGSQEDPTARLRVITDLQDPARRPPPPDDADRRYRWIDNTGAGSGVPDVDRKRFYGDVDQVLFEAIDNVHRWADATAALACCAVTRGGGEGSFNRFHVVVIDDGMGIHQSIRRRREAEGLGPWEKDRWVEKFAAEHQIDAPEALVRLLVLEANAARAAEPTDPGQGLHAMETLSGQWAGSFSMMTGDGSTCWWVARTGGGASLQSGSWPAPGLHGVALHATLEGRPNNAASKRPSTPPSDHVSSPAKTPALV